MRAWNQDRKHMCTTNVHVLFIVQIYVQNELLEFSQNN